MSSGSTILKPAHIELLQKVAAGRAFVSFSSKPARALVDMGLCVWIERQYSRHLGLTEAGRFVLHNDLEAA